MPSSHSGLCVGITTAIAIQYGTAGALFPLSLGFSLIVMYDACNVRRHAGHTAEVLNKVVDELFKVGSARPSVRTSTRQHLPARLPASLAADVRER